jgi:asparagine synthetase B (glutamine-hydrolysing)
MTGLDATQSDRISVLDCLDPLDSFERQHVSIDDCILAVAGPANTPSADHRLESGERFTGLIVGDPVSDQLFDWSAVFAAIENRNSGRFSFADLHGAFAIAMHDREAQEITIATDAFGFQPVYVMETRRGFLVSTALASFLRLTSVPPVVDHRWIHEYLFFNYPVLDTTLLANVRRLPAGTLTTIDLRAGSMTTERYVTVLDRQPSSRSRAEEIDDACSLFEKIVPKWFETGREVAFGLSGGLDSRAVLAALPETAREYVTAFTYGIPGSTEINEARAIARAVDFRHRELFLADQFLADLPALMHETVWLSDTLQVINRSNLPLVYGSLAPADDPVSAILTGVSGDHLFRDHISAWGNVAYLISADVAAMHRGGRQRLDRDFYHALFVDDITDIVAYLESVLDSIEQNYGPFGDPDAYYRYLMYVAGSRYFGGQAAIANQYSTFRTPYWDRRMVQFGMDIELGTVGLSTGTTAKSKYEETVLQGTVVARHPQLRKVPYMNLPVSVFARKTSASYQIHRVLRKTKTLLTKRRRVPEENWPLWYETVLADEIADLFGSNSRIKAYVREDFIESQLRRRDIHWLGKLMTVEIALRLVETGWQKRPTI